MVAPAGSAWQSAVDGIDSRAQCSTWNEAEDGRDLAERAKTDRRLRRGSSGSRHSSAMANFEAIHPSPFHECGPGCRGGQVDAQCRFLVCVAGLLDAGVITSISFSYFDIAIVRWTRCRSRSAATAWPGRPARRVLPPDLTGAGRVRAARQARSLATSSGASLGQCPAAPGRVFGSRLAFPGVSTGVSRAPRMAPSGVVTAVAF